jgi:hypothetical protein
MKQEQEKNKFFVGLHGDKAYNSLFVETPRKFITAKLSIVRDEDPGLRIESVIFGSFEEEM